MLQAYCRLEQAEALMKIVEVLPGCSRDPVWVTAVSSSDQPGVMRIVVSNDDPPFDAPRYQFQVSCRKADVKLVSDLYRLHCGSDAQSSCKPFAENVDSTCIKGEGCALCNLSLEEAFFPLVVYELASNKTAPQSHWDD